jgi:hypothetical protein
MPCQCCGVDGPTAPIRFRQNIGMGYARRTSEIAGDLCRPCIGQHFCSYTLTTLFLGWWGIVSVVLTPVILFANIRQYLSARRLPDPPLGSFNGPLDSLPPIVSSGTFAIELIYGIVVMGGVLLVVAYFQVELTEKYFPALNAAMHNHGIEDEDDMKYVFVRIKSDASVLESAADGSTWASARSVLLQKEANLVDLEAQNAKLQPKMALERASNLDANDACERWTLSEFGPALKNYTVAQRALFSAAKASPTITPQNYLALQAVLNQEQESSRQLRQALFDADKFCTK